MSVITRADENLKQAVELLDEARDLLYETAYQECAGWDDYYEEYQEKVQASFFDLTRITDRLNP